MVGVELGVQVWLENRTSLTDQSRGQTSHHKKRKPGVVYKAPFHPLFPHLDTPVEDHRSLFGCRGRGKAEFRVVENCIQVPQLRDDRMGMMGKAPGHPMGCCSRSFSMLVNSTSSWKAPWVSTTHQHSTRAKRLFILNRRGMHWVA